MRSCLQREGSYYAMVVRLFFGRRLAGRDLGAGTSEVTARLFLGGLTRCHAFQSANTKTGGCGRADRSVWLLRLFRDRTLRASR
jgi:hypothetical protein